MKFVVANRTLHWLRFAMTREYLVVFLFLGSVFPKDSATSKMHMREDGVSFAAHQSKHVEDLPI